VTILVQENKPNKPQVSHTRLEDDRAKGQYFENEADEATIGSSYILKCPVSCRLVFANVRSAATILIISIRTSWVIQASQHAHTYHPLSTNLGIKRPTSNVDLLCNRWLTGAKDG